VSKILLVLAKRKLSLYQRNNLINKFPVAIGKPSHPTPTGNFKIINKLKNPYNPALGTRWMQFTHQMHGIHGTNQPRLIGQAVSHGCVRMYNQDVEALYNQVAVGTAVQIKQQPQSAQQNFANYFLYTVQPNDTLYKIANKFNSSVNKLVQINNLQNKTLIYPGQTIKIPTA